jgi:hypothetical protein
MKKRSHRITLILFLLLLNLTLLWGCLAIQEVQLNRADFYKATLSKIDRIPPPRPAPASRTLLLAGAAKLPLPLSPGLPMAGYGKRVGTAKGMHDLLYARALALKQGEERVIVISADLLAVTDEIREAVLQKIRAKIPFPKNGLMIAATHTHSGPGALSSGFLEQFAAGAFDRPYFEKMTDTLAESALLAAGALTPVRVGHGVAAAPDLIRNRMKGQIRSKPKASSAFVEDNRSGPVDPEVRFVEMVGERGERIAILVNFSAHATVLKPDNLHFSGDYPGFFETALEEQGGVTLFTAGSVADQTAHPPEGSDRYRQAEAMGRELARRVGESPRTISEEGFPLSAQTLSVQLPPAQVKTKSGKRLAPFLSAPFFDSETIVQTIQIGPVLLIGIPGDLSVLLGEKIKAHARARGMEGMIVGFANDYIGYLLPRDLYQTSAYEARMSFYGPQMGEYLVEVVERLIDRMHRPISLEETPPERAGREVSQ